MSRFVRLSLSGLMLGLVAALLAILPTTSAQAIDCDYVVRESGGQVMERHEICQNFNVEYLGAKVTETYSDYTYFTRWPQNDPEIYQIVRLTDTQADGKCVSIRASKEGGDFPFNELQRKVCGKDETIRFDLTWNGMNMAEGTLLLWVCEGTSCKPFYARHVSG